jgi:small subunit ribosomal protein S17
MATTTSTESKGKQLKGIVVSDKMKDTVVVKVSSYKKHPKYQKFLSKDKRYKAHDEGNTLKVGDQVVIQECRPISKDKKFIVVK